MKSELNNSNNNNDNNYNNEKSNKTPSGKNNSTNKKYLFIFDMDKTIIKLTSEEEIKKLIEERTNNKYKISDIEESIKEKIWLEQIQHYYDLFSTNSITVKDIEEKVKSIPLNDGMDKFFNSYLRELKKNNPLSHVVIMSGANTLFVKWIIEKYGLEDIVDAYYAYNYKIDENKLIVSSFHNHACERCNKYFCKKLALEQLYFRKISKIKSNEEYDLVINNDKFSNTFEKELNEVRICADNFKYNNRLDNIPNKENEDNNKRLKWNDTEHDNIFFFGDGDNDYCAALALNNFKNNSTMFYRKNQAIYEMLFGTEVSKSSKMNISKEQAEKNRNDLNSHLQVWKDGNDLVEYFENFENNNKFKNCLKSIVNNNNNNNDTKVIANNFNVNINQTNNKN